MITSTICHDEPKFYLNLMHFDVVVYVTHSVNANNTKKKKRQFGIEIPYHTLYICSWEYPYLNCTYMVNFVKNGVLDTYRTYGVHANLISIYGY